MKSSELEALRARLAREPSFRLRTMLSEPARDTWAPEAREIAQEILTERGERSTSPQGCPACGGEFEHGRVGVRGTWMAFLAVGFGRQHLWFSSEESGCKDIVLHRHDSRPAARGRDCGALLIAGG